MKTLFTLVSIMYVLVGHPEPVAEKTPKYILPGYKVYDVNHVILTDGTIVEKKWQLNFARHGTNVTHRGKTSAEKCR